MHAVFTDYRTAKPVEIAKVSIRGGQLTVSGWLPESALQTLNEGVPSRDGTGILRAADGDEFLRALPHVFSGSRLRAGLRP